MSTNTTSTAASATAFASASAGRCSLVSSKTNLDEVSFDSVESVVEILVKMDAFLAFGNPNYPLDEVGQYHSGGGNIWKPQCLDKSTHWKDTVLLIFPWTDLMLLRRHRSGLQAVRCQGYRRSVRHHTSQGSQGTYTLQLA